VTDSPQKKRPRSVGLNAVSNDPHRRVGDLWPYRAAFVLGFTLGALSVFVWGLVL